MQNVISYYPTYALLDSVLSYQGCDILNLYIDLKCVARPTYMLNVKNNIVSSTKMLNRIDPSFFLSLLEFFIFHKKYTLKRNIKINFYVFYEFGESFYHLNINKRYKANRKIDNVPGLDKVDKEIYNNIIQKNLVLIEKVFNKIPNIKIFLLDHLEADFVPYYLIKNNLVPNNDMVCHIVYSNDHDLFQNMALGKNIYQFLKTKSKRIIKGNDGVSEYLKFKCDISIEYFPLVMAILGDRGDNIIDKAQGVGKKSVPKIINQVVDLVGGMDNLYNNILSDEPIFEFDMNKIENKLVYSVVEAEHSRSTISKNLKLMSFEILSRYFDTKPTVELMNRKKNMYNILNNTSIAKSNSIYLALNKIGILTESENPLNILYLNKNISDYYEF